MYISQGVYCCHVHNEGYHFKTNKKSQNKNEAKLITGWGTSSVAFKQTDRLCNRSRVEIINYNWNCSRNNRPWL